MLSGNPAANTNANRYVRAGLETANDQIALQADIRKAAPSYDKMSLEYSKQEALNTKAMIDSAVSVRKEADNAQYQIERSKQDIEAAQIIKKKKFGQAMAGKVAAAGALAADATFRKDPLPPLTIDYSEFDEYFNKRRREIQGDYEEDMNRPFQPLTDPRTGQTSQTSSGATMTPGNNQTDGWSRWSKVIRFAEGTDGPDGYKTMFGGGTFEDMSKHPDTVISANGYNSAAAGAYQFMPGTWSEAQKATGVTDFGVESQEKAARFLTKRRGVDPDAVITNEQDFYKALNTLSPEWASLPTMQGVSYHGQPVKSQQELWKIYKGAGFNLQPSKADAPTLSGGYSPQQFRVGSTGNSTGNHLDFRVYSKSKGGYVDNPGDYTQFVSTESGQGINQFQVTSPYGMREHPIEGGHEATRRY